ncbi:hypothetical protein FBF72_42540, partial [Bradyrhizobium elkanii]|nr:hypothetical protein [Bradyrhizobium elkanii]
GRTYGCKRSDLTKKLLCHGGRPHMGPGFRRDDTECVTTLLRRHLPRRRRRVGEGGGELRVANFRVLSQRRCC